MAKRKLARVNAAMSDRLVSLMSGLFLKLRDKESNVKRWNELDLMDGTHCAHVAAWHKERHERALRLVGMLDEEFAELGVKLPSYLSCKT